MSDQKYVTLEQFEVAMLRMMRLFLIANEKAEIAEAVSRLVGVAEEDRRVISLAIQAKYQAIRDRIERTPVLDALEALRHFEGPIQ